MRFKPDTTKQAKEVIFSSKRTKDHHPPLRFNDYQINEEKSRKYIGLTLDEKHTFAEHVRESIVRAKRGIGIICLLSKYTSRDILDQMYKSEVYQTIDIVEPRTLM